MDSEDEKSIAELYQIRIGSLYKANELEAEAKRLREDVKYLTIIHLAGKFDTTKHKVKTVLRKHGLLRYQLG